MVPELNTTLIFKYLAVVGGIKDSGSGAYVLQLPEDKGFAVAVE